MRHPTYSFVDSTWARHAQAANGFGDAILFDAHLGATPGHVAEHDVVRPRRWTQAIASALRALAAAARARATKRRQRRLARETFLVLNGLDGRALRDLGFDRSEIASVACELAGLAEPTRAHPERLTRGR
jgi:uncharacterized protein YjiS (DUF1127 family)